MEEIKVNMELLEGFLKQYGLGLPEFAILLSVAFLALVFLFIGLRLLIGGRREAAWLYEGEVITADLKGKIDNLAKDLTRIMESTRRESEYVRHELEDIRNALNELKENVLNSSEPRMIDFDISSGVSKRRASLEDIFDYEL